ncbi:hypothetical protein [Tabrizicola flagellatus]|uniref:hypothetical protein n=1 Tax=Tabrizicola flagellatus TaxID=2593021 RepID=UPI0011F1DF09|nr:hypothetical protein [Tabrizicola flagellatus]
MKPTFALDLTRETIGLLHRTPKGWLSIGEVAFDAPDLAEALDYMRKTALGLSPMGLATKLILPNSQILYTEIHAPGPSRDEKRRQIAAALEGRTPYAVEELVFDWSGKGATVKVAVVAKETLAEAEAFAVEHRLNPVSFVAIPEDGTFVGEPWFGPTNAAASLLSEDETVERDREPVTVLHRELPKAAPAAEAEVAPLAPEAETVSEPATASAPPPAPAAPVEDDDPLPGLEEALNADLPVAEVTPVAQAAEPAALDLMDEEGPVADLPPAPQAAVATERGIDRAAAMAASAPSAPARGPEPQPEPEEAPFAHVTDTQAFPEGDTDMSPAAAAPVGTRAGKGSVSGVLADTVEDDIPPAPPSAAMVAFASRRAAAGEAAARPVDGVTRPAVAAKTAAARPATAKGYSGLVTAPSIPGTRAKVKVKGGDIPRPSLGPTTVKSPARPGGTFGAAVPAKRRSGTVFMIMVGLLLLFLALVAAWASYFIGSRDAAPQAAATETIPDASDEMLADMQDPEGLTEPLPEAGESARSADLDALATESLAADAGEETAQVADPEAVEPDVPADATAVAAEIVEPVPEPTPEPVAEAPATPPVQPAPEPAPDTAVTTEVATASAPVEDQDEIFLSAMDAPPPALDALALPPLADPRDSLPDPVMPPPAPGTVYQFDAAGLLKPTPEGILSPDGVFLIAGKPPLVPPPRSEAAAAAAQAAAAVSAPPAEAGAAASDAADASLATAGETADPEATIPSDPEMAGFRPRPRPEGLAPAAAGGEDDASLGSAAATRFAGLRPLPRPASVTAAAAAILPASAAPADLGAQGASLTAQAQAKLAEAAALEAQNPSIVAISMRPAARPQDMSRAVEAAVAAAVREPAPAAPKEEVVEVAAAAPAAAKPEEIDELDEPEVAKAAPSIPTKASVAKQATFVNAINLSKINLIGTYGTDSRRYALIRQSNGKYKKVKVGDKIDGGTVKAITETEVRYQKGGRLVSLKMPKA